MSIDSAEINAVSYSSTLELEYEFSIGNKKFPEYNIGAQSQAYTQLEKRTLKMFILTIIVL